MVKPLKSRNKGKKLRAHTHPHSNDDYHRHHIFGVEQEVYRLGDKAPVKKERVDISELVSRKKELPDDKGVSRNRRSVNEEDKRSPKLWRQLIKRPRENQRTDIAEGSYYYSHSKRVNRRFCKNGIREEKGSVICNSDKLWRLSKVVACKA